MPPTALGFTAGAVRVAGGLYSTAADPSAHLPAAAAGQVDYRVDVTWDSARRAAAYSTVT